MGGVQANYGIQLITLIRYSLRLREINAGQVEVRVHPL